MVTVYLLIDLAGCWEFCNLLGSRDLERVSRTVYWVQVPFQRDSGSLLYSPFRKVRSAFYRRDLPRSNSAKCFFGSMCAFIPIAWGSKRSSKAETRSPT